VKPTITCGAGHTTSYETSQCVLELVRKERAIPPINTTSRTLSHDFLMVWRRRNEIRFYELQLHIDFSPILLSSTKGTLLTEYFC